MYDYNKLLEDVKAFPWIIRSIDSYVQVGTRKRAEYNTKNCDLLLFDGGICFLCESVVYAPIVKEMYDFIFESSRESADKHFGKKYPNKPVGGKP
jgi:hypothetical protein